MNETFKAIDIPRIRMLDYLQSPSSNRTFKKWICFKHDSSDRIHVGKILSKLNNRSSELQIIRYHIITYNTTDNTYLLSPHETSNEQRPINLIPKSNKCKVITVKRNPEGSGYILMTPMDTDLLKLPNSTSEFNYASVPNITPNPEIIVVQQLSHDS